MLGTLERLAMECPPVGEWLEFIGRRNRPIITGYGKGNNSKANQ